jgi:pyruvate-formate lyase-activating enzyme
MRMQRKTFHRSTLMETALNFFRSPAMHMVACMVKKWMLELYAFLSGNRFYCEALSGLSTYDLAVHSDFVLSCNHKDDCGLGTLGTCAEHDVIALYRGPVATRFRQSLAAGILPIPICARCGALRMADAKRSLDKALHYNPAPRSIMIENTSACNLRCLSCDRHSIRHSRKKSTLSLIEIESLSDTIKANNISHINFFTYGEPFASPSILHELTILRKKNPTLSILLSTNGLLVDTDEKRAAAMLVDTIIFSIHGMSEETLRRYQVGGDFARAYHNLTQLISFRNRNGYTRPSIQWKYLLFNWNDRPEMILKAIDLAEASRVDQIWFEPTRAPFWGTSLRYHFHPFFKTVGVKSWKGRVVEFESSRSDCKPTFHHSQTGPVRTFATSLPPRRPMKIRLSPKNNPQVYWEGVRGGISNDTVGTQNPQKDSHE